MISSEYVSPPEEDTYARLHGLEAKTSALKHFKDANSEELEEMYELYLAGRNLPANIRFIISKFSEKPELNELSALVWNINELFSEAENRSISDFPFTLSSNNHVMYDNIDITELYLLYNAQLKEKDLLSKMPYCYENTRLGNIISTTKKLNLRFRLVK